LVSQVNAVKDGTWTNTPYWGGLKDGVVKLAPLTKNVNSNASEVVDEYTKKIIDGSFHVFQGEIKDQKGNVVVEKGETLTDGELLGMDWFVEGVIGKI
jgi:basic membrane protein A